MTRRLALAAALLAPLLVLRASTSEAHAIGISRGEYRVEGTEVHAGLVFARRELVAAFPGLDVDHDGDLSGEEVRHAQGALADWVGRGVEVEVATGACSADVQGVALAENDGIAFDARYRCPQAATAFRIRLALFTELSPGHRHLLAITSSSQPVHAVIYESQAAFSFVAANPTAETPAASSLFRLGVEHILTGYDHLLFLLALVLVTGPLRSLLGAVTAFTLAHSISLAIATLGAWAPQPSFVEPAIALSIVFVGVENCFVPDLRGRWRLTFAFGLVHGFGFAGALREIALPAAQLPLALASFNAGVEIGQLAVLALVVPSLWWLGRRNWFAAGGFRVPSLAISAMGLWWFVVRVGGG